MKLKEKEKDPKKIKAGRARWMNVSAADRRQQASINGKKGAASLWRKYKLVRLSTGVLDSANTKE